MAPHAASPDPQPAMPPEEPGLHPCAAGVELLCIGTELLLGNIVNSNARWLAERLAELGLPHYRQEVVGDNRERLIASVRAAAGRSRLLITTGGLGPTPDDLTTEAIAAAFDTPLQEDPEVWAGIQARLAGRGRPIAASNRRQALRPVGSALLANPSGTAPGILWTPRPGFSVLTLPGVPSEMRLMWESGVVPWLHQQGLVQGMFRSRLLRFWGVSEAALAEQVADLLETVNPTVAPYAGGGEVRLRITARAGNPDEAAALLAPVEADLRRRTGDHCFGCDEESLASVVLEQLRARGETLSVAESCTGGGIGAALTAVPGSSQVLLGGVIAYANRLKQELLGVPAALLDRHGAVSEPVVRAMAAGARQLTGSDWSLAVSGVAGPGGGSVDKPVGLVHLAWEGPGGSWAQEMRFHPSRGREAIRQLTCGEALNRLRLQLLQA